MEILANYANFSGSQWIVLRACLFAIAFIDNICRSDDIEHDMQVESSRVESICLISHTDLVYNLNDTLHNLKYGGFSFRTSDKVSDMRKS